MKKTKGRQTRDGAQVRRVQVTLDEETTEKAKAIGDGNLSQGIRQAVRGATMGMKKHEIEAICQMAEATHDYNRGVLWMLGHWKLALAHESACAMVGMLVAQRDSLTPEGASPLDPLPERAAEVQGQIEEAQANRTAAWTPIQAIINEARRLRDEADPLGLDQPV